MTTTLNQCIIPLSILPLKHTNIIHTHTISSTIPILYLMLPPSVHYLTINIDYILYILNDLKLDILCLPEIWIIEFDSIISNSLTNNYPLYIKIVSDYMMGLVFYTGHIFVYFLANILIFKTRNHSPIYSIRLMYIPLLL